MKYSRIFAFMVLAGMATGVQATNGYFSHGYGMKAKGMGGAATTNTEDAFGGANNPATMAFAGNRFELGVELFSPPREASRSGSLSGLNGTSESDSNLFPVPELGYNHMLNPNLALGVTVYGNGGMNTDYPALGGVFGNTNLLGGQGSLGVDLAQLIVAPTLAFKVAPNHAIGVSPLLGYQRFAATGLQAFSVVSSSPGNLTDRGHDSAFGYGVRIGYVGKITPTVTIGAAYASKMNFEEFDKYRGLFAEQGDFDIPENYNLGISWQSTPSVRLALDYQRINYNDVDSVGNSISQLLVSGQPLGSNRGPGFGWENINVWKLGMEYKYSPKWTFRAGYSHSDNPIKSSEVVFNILAPAVVENHATVGFTYTVVPNQEMTMFYMHAFKNDVTGADVPFGGTDRIQIYQNAVGFQYSWKM